MTNVHNIGYSKEPFIAKLPLSGKWSDTSWKNDVCDSVSADVFGRTITVWFDYINPADREFPEAPQFSATFEDDQIIATNDFDQLVGWVWKFIRDKWQAESKRVDNILEHHDIADQFSDDCAPIGGVVFPDGSYMTIVYTTMRMFSVPVSNTEKLFVNFGVACDHLWEQHSKMECYA